MAREPSNPTRITATEHLVLATLHELGEAHGLQLHRAANVSRGSVYVLLSRMQARGLVESSYAADPARSLHSQVRLYRVTPVGRTALRAWIAAQKAW